MIIELDLDKLLKKKEEKKTEQPALVIESVTEISIETTINEPREIPFRFRTEGRQLKGDILGELEQQMRDVRIARARLSNKYPEMVRRGASSRELAVNYAEIESYTHELQDIYGKIRYAERYGSLPDPEPARPDPAQSDNLIELKAQLRSLIDKKCKLKKKIEPTARSPKNPDRMTLWSLELDQVDAEYKRIKEKYKALKLKLRSDE